MPLVTIQGTITYAGTEDRATEIWVRPSDFIAVRFNGTLARLVTTHASYEFRASWSDISSLAAKMEKALIPLKTVGQADGCLDIQRQAGYLSFDPDKVSSVRITRELPGDVIVVRLVLASDSKSVKYRLTFSDTGAAVNFVESLP